jgi:hypothetical protein
MRFSLADVLVIFEPGAYPVNLRLLTGKMTVEEPKKKHPWDMKILRLMK